MKKILLICLALTVFACGAAFSAAGEGAEAKPAVATASNNSFTVILPDDWKQDAAEGKFVMSLTGPSGIPNISVSADPVEKIELSTLEEATVEALKQELKSVKMISQKRVGVSGMPASEMVYTAVVDGITVQFKSVFGIRKNVLYVFTFGTLPRMYDADVKDFNSITKSVKWLN